MLVPGMFYPNDPHRLESLDYELEAVFLGPFPDIYPDVSTGHVFLKLVSIPTVSSQWLLTVECDG